MRIAALIFGLIGTISSFLRDTGNKTLASTLSPRDESFVFVRLLLGAIAGIAVGLFYNPTESSQQVTTGAGVLTLSASGFSFLAGYAADAFFSFLASRSRPLYSANVSSEGRQIMTPRSPSTISISPDATSASPAAPTTAGISSDLAMIAVCDSGLPVSVASAASNASVIVTVVLSAILLHQPLGRARGAAIALTLLGPTLMALSTG